MKSFLLSSLLFMGSLNAQGPPATPPGQANNAGTAAPPATPATPAQVTPQVPPTTPQYGPPAVNPYNPYQPQFPGAFMGQMDPQYLNCEMGQCRNRRITMSPGQGFTLNCKLPFQCDGLDLTLNVGHDPTNWGSGVSEINDLNFDVPTNGVKIRINNVTPGNNIELNNIKCKVRGSCANMQITTVPAFGVELQNVYCEQWGACDGCTINGQSCAMYSMMNGNSNGYMPYGYGYTNTANVPAPQYGAPQQPGAPGAQPAAPAQPQYQPPAYNPYQYPAMPQFQPYPQWI